MNEIQNRITEIEKEIDKLNDEKYDLIKQNSNYYIGVEMVGDGDYFEEHIHRLGFVTEDVALRWKNLPSYTDAMGREYYAVNEKQYKLYGRWYNLDKAKWALLAYGVSNLDHVSSAIESIEKEISRIINEIGIEDLSSQEICEDLMLKNE